jgi:hypothetical protein
MTIPLVREILPELINQIIVLISGSEFEQQEVIKLSSQIINTYNGTVDGR